MRLSSSHFRLGLALTLLAVCSGVARVAAHAPPEVIRVLSRAANDTVVATTRGILRGDRVMRRFSLLCGQAFNAPAGSRYEVARMATGRLLVGDAVGLRVSDDAGCTWQPHPELGALAVLALAQPSAPLQPLYAAVEADGHSSIRYSDDGGGHFRLLHAAPQGTRIESLRVLPETPPQLVAVASTEDWTRYLVLRSVGAADALEVHVLRVDASETSVTLLAVNPADPTELVARAQNRETLEGDRLLLSRDGGRSFADAGRFVGIASAIFSDDGANLYVGTAAGLLHAGTPSRTLAPVGDSAGLGALTVHDGELLVGGYFAADGASLGGLATTALGAPGATFSPWLRYDDVRSQLTCPAPSTAERDCAFDWLDWTAEFLTRAGGGSLR